MHLYSKLDCGFPDKPEVAEAGDLAELAYIRCMLRARAALTDGIIDRRTIGRWLVGIRGKPAAHMQRLVDVGLILVHPDGWCFPLEVWKRWNPLASEIEQKRQDEADRKRHYRATQQSQRDETGTSDVVPLGHPSASAVRPVQPEIKREIKKENTPSNGIAENGSSALPRATVSKPEDDPDFGAFWASYPRRVAKQEAAVAYRKAKKTAAPEEILAGLKRCELAWRAEGRNLDKYPHASTWLNGQRWRDELDDVRPANGISHLRNLPLEGAAS